MVVGDVREDPAGEVETADALLDDGVRRALHEAVLAAGVDHLTHHGVQANGIGRRVRGLDLASVDAVDDRRDQSGTVAQTAHQVVEQRDGRGLAVGSRDAHQPQFAAREVVEGRGQIGHRPRRIPHHDIDDAGSRLLGAPLADHRRSSPFDGHRDIVVAVALRAPDGEEAVAGVHVPRVVGQPPDRGFGITRHRHDGHMTYQFRNFLHLSISTLWLPPSPE